MKNRIIQSIDDLLTEEGSNHKKNVEFEYKYGDIIVFVTGELDTYFKEEIVFETKIEEVLKYWCFTNIVVEFHTNDGEILFKLENVFKKIAERD